MSKFAEETEAFTRLCPKCWKAISERRYLLPNYRQVDYASQIKLLEWYVGYLFNLLRGSFSETELRFSTHFGNIALALEYRRPTYFLERELGEILVKTPLPSAAYLEAEIKWKVPHFRVFLPSGLITIRDQGQNCPVPFLDIFRTTPGRIVTFPRELAWELAHCYRWDDVIRESASQMQEWKLMWSERDGFGICCSTESSASTVTQSSILLHWNQLDDPREDYLDQAVDLGLNILWFLSTVPEELVIAEDTPRRKARMEGDRFLSGQYPAKFIGQIQRSWSKTIPVKHSIPNPNGTPHASHWVAGHWTNQAHGLKKTLRKKLWIQTYFAEGNKPDSSRSETNRSN